MRFNISIKTSRLLLPLSNPSVLWTYEDERGHKMTKKFKTHQKKRLTFTYESSYGPSTTVKPGEDGVTEVDINECRLAHNREVEGYWKQLRPNRTDKEKAEIREWTKGYIEEFKTEHWTNVKYLDTK